MRIAPALVVVCILVPATVSLGQRTSPSVREAMRRGRLPGETSQELRARLRMLESMDKLNALGAEATPTKIRLGPKYRGGTGGMSLIKDFYGLESLEVIRPASQITDAGLAIVAKIPSVQAIRIEGTRLTDTSLAHLARLTDLKQVALIDTGLTDASFRSFASLRSLEAVRISEPKFNGSGLSHLRQCSNLSSLQLEQSGVTDESLTHLEPFRSLRFLSVTDTQVSDEALLAMWRTNPDLLIVSAAGGKAAHKGEPFGVPVKETPSTTPRQAIRPRVP
ncbi:MAG: hypothetical protein KDA42_05350 [Planctomycetales bacterium]|nr:hypothetical protein [Planctomycetales bacterium]